jgi:hypothetical protein
MCADVRVHVAAPQPTFGLVATIDVSCMWFLCGTSTAPCPRFEHPGLAILNAGLRSWYRFEPEASTHHRVTREAASTWPSRAAIHV